MDPVSALALLDALLTATERVSSLVAEYRKQGLITAEEQASRAALVDTIRARVFGAGQSPSAG